MLSDALYVKGVEVRHQSVELLFGDVFERGLRVGAAVVQQDADPIVIMATIPTTYPVPSV